MKKVFLILGVVCVFALLILIASMVTRIYFVMQELAREQERPTQNIATTTAPTPVSYMDALNNVAQGAFVDVSPAISKILSDTSLYFMIATADGSVIRSVVYENGGFKENDDQFGSDVLYSYSPDLKNVVFFAIPSEKKAADTRTWVEKKENYSNSIWAEQATLFQTSLGSSTRIIADALGKATAVDTTTIAYKQLPVISNSGEMLFVGWDKSYVPSVENAESWSIYKMIDGKPVFVANGFDPIWTADGNVLFLKNDGVYKTNASFSSPKKVISLQTTQKVRSDEQIVLSADMSHVAWMRPEQSQVLLFAKNLSGVFEKQNTYSAVGFQILFSPDGSLLAVQTQGGRATQVGESLSSKIDFFDLLSAASTPQGEVVLDKFGHFPVRMVNWITSFNK